jgi:hypothetical protein
MPPRFVSFVFEECATFAACSLNKLNALGGGAESCYPSVGEADEPGTLEKPLTLSTTQVGYFIFTHGMPS